MIAYAPTEDSAVGVKDDVYQQLSGAFDELPVHDVNISKCIGQDNSAWSEVIGKNSLHVSSNDNGLRLLDFCAIHQLTNGGTSPDPVVSLDWT